MDLWSYHDAKLRELKKLYDRTSLNIRNRIQELIDTFNFNKETIFNITDNKTKKRIDAYIEKWKDDGLLTGHFEILAKNIYSRTRVKNSEILELLIYSAYIEEENKQQEKEMKIFKEDVSYYYNEGINEVRKAKQHKPLFCIIPDSIFLYLMEQINSMGHSWKQYIELSLMNNVNQIYRQVLINIQQQKELKMDSDEFNIILNRQNKQKLNINENKISGVVDIELIGLNNQAKIKGIESQDNDAQVRFIAVTDEHSTEMCQSMDNMLFYINKDNEFYRMYGENKNELRNYRIKCKGLILGINLPPISHHWHWCRSTIEYISPPLEKENKTEYNGLASNTTNNIKEHPKPKLLKKINYNNKEEVKDTLKKYEKIIKNDANENAIVITRDGEVYQCYGDNKNVWPDYDLQDRLQEAYMTHNHPKNETQYSFSEDDIALFNNYNLKTLRGIDYKYTYELKRNSKEIDEISIEDLMEEDNGVHALNINRASRMNIGYRRWKND